MHEWRNITTSLQQSKSLFSAKFSVYIYIDKTTKWNLSPHLTARNIGGGAGEEGAKSWGSSAPPPLQRFGAEKTLLRCIWQYLCYRRLQSAHFLSSDDSRTTWEAAMKQDRLNNCLLMHCHKSITDTLDTVKIAKSFACANKQRKIKGHFGTSEACSWVEMSPSPPHPPPPSRFKTLRRLWPEMLCCMRRAILTNSPFR